MKLLSLLPILLFALSMSAHASGDLVQRMNSLGANEDLIKKVNEIDPHNRVRVVQHREVDRRMRLEIGVGYGMNAGGDSYVNTSILGGQLDFHFTPHWSLGARYYNMNNSLTPEGKQVMSDASAHLAAHDFNFSRPETDFASHTWLVVGNWYPIYGKMDLFERSVAQFDFYMLGGAGQTALEQGTVPTYTAGGGLGLWLNQHLSARLEARWQGYKDHLYGGRDINFTVLSATMGFLL